MLQIRNSSAKKSNANIDVEDFHLSNTQYNIRLVCKFKISTKMV